MGISVRIKLLFFVLYGFFLINFSLFLIIFSVYLGYIFLFRYML